MGTREQLEEWMMLSSEARELIESGQFDTAMRKLFDIAKSASGSGESTIFALAYSAAMLLHYNDVTGSIGEIRDLQRECLNLIRYRLRTEEY